MNPHLFTAHNLDAYREAMHRGVDALVTHVEGLDGPFTGASVDDVARVVEAVDLDRPLGDVDRALSELRRVYLDDAVWFHDPRYVAHLNCPVVLPALVAEVLVSAVNSSLDTWDQSAGGTIVERRLVEWTARRAGLPATADGVFTSGGSQSNLQALLVAREKVSARRLEPADEVRPRLRVFASQDAHFSVVKSARVLGLADDAVVPVPLDASRRLDAWELDRLVGAARARGEVPMAVVATAGTTDFGVIDPLERVADVCAARGVWMHVDAAYGGGLLVSERRRHLLAGVERADSVTVDFHKTFFQPVSSSAVLVRQGDDLRHVTHHADYLNPRGAGLPNQVDKSLQTTRRFDALKLWMTLRVMGADAVGEILDEAIDLAHEGRAVLRRTPDLEVAAAPVLSTLVFRFRPPGTSVADADEVNPRIRRELFGGGEAVVAGTTVDGHAWLKLTLLNPDATIDDLEHVFALVRASGLAMLRADERVRTA